jgi:uncharacterized Zn finger protein
MDDKIICPNCGNETSASIEYIDREDVFRYIIRCTSCGKATSKDISKSDIVEYIGARNHDTNQDEFRQGTRQ